MQSCCRVVGVATQEQTHEMLYGAGGGEAGPGGGGGGSELYTTKE